MQYTLKIPEWHYELYSVCGQRESNVWSCLWTIWMQMIITNHLHESRIVAESSLTGKDDRRRQDATKNRAWSQSAASATIYIVRRDPQHTPACTKKNVAVEVLLLNYLCLDREPGALFCGFVLPRDTKGIWTLYAVSMWCWSTFLSYRLLYSPSCEESMAEVSTLTLVRKSCIFIVFLGMDSIIITIIIIISLPFAFLTMLKENDHLKVVFWHYS